MQEIFLRFMMVIFWGYGQKNFDELLFGLSVTILFVKGTKKDFHFYPARVPIFLSGALHQYIFFHLLLCNRLRFHIVQPRWGSSYCASK